MTERIVKSNGLEIWAESFGDPQDTALLLIAGASAQAIFWADEFCRQLVLGGRFVIRYDNRDTGQSDSVDFNLNPYTTLDLAEDAVAVLDAHDVLAAHVVGVSGGGLICQALALEHRDRLITISALISSLLGTGSSEAANGGYGELPPPSLDFLEELQDFVGEVPSDRQDFINWTLRKYRLIAGSLEAFDEDSKKAQAELEFERARNLQAMNNHPLAFAAASATPISSLRRLKIPTLVIHGTEDRLLPFAHGEAIAQTIPGAKLLAIEKMGHDLPQAAWPKVISAILEHTSR